MHDHGDTAVGLFRMSAPLGGGMLQAAAGFLSGRGGQAMASLTGRLVDGQGGMLAVGDIHPQIIAALASRYPFVRDFALAHGCDSTGQGGSAIACDEQARSIAWWKARKAWKALMALPRLPPQPFH